MPLKRYKLTIAYDGSSFRGWQRQVPPDGPELRTVQGVMTDSMVRTLAQPIRVQGASRTDSGVHAMGQVAHFDAETRIPDDRIAAAINARLPEDVEVRCAQVAAADFDACTDAIEKQYRYRIWNSPRRPLGERRRVYHGWMPLDADRMIRAAAVLVGTHDFAAFTAANHGRESTVRTITACTVERHQSEVPELHIVVRGDGFLYNMVRIIAGTLVEVGRGRFDERHVVGLLSDPRRDKAGRTLPPQGLCLEWVRYVGDPIP